MKALVAQWSLILLCFSMAAALGGGLYESFVLIPLWSKAPPASFAIIQPGTGVLSSVGFSLMPLWAAVGRHRADRQPSRDSSATVLGVCTPPAGADQDRARPG
jgi:hypothetical protein